MFKLKKTKQTRRFGVESVVAQYSKLKTLGSDLDTALPPIKQLGGHKHIMYMEF